MPASFYSFPWYVFGDIETVLAVRSDCTSPEAVAAENDFYDWVNDPNANALPDAGPSGGSLLISHIRQAVEAVRQAVNPWPSSWPLSVALVQPRSGSTNRPPGYGPSNPSMEVYLKGTTCYIAWPPPRFAGLPLYKQQRFYTDTGLSAPSAPPPSDAVPISALLYAYDWGYVEGNDPLLIDAVNDPNPNQRRIAVTSRLQQLVYPGSGSFPGALSVQIDPTVPTVNTAVLVSSGATTAVLGTMKAAPTIQMDRYPCGGFDT